MASAETTTPTTYTQAGAGFGNFPAGSDIHINNITYLRPLADEINASFFDSSDVFHQVQDEVSRLSLILGITAKKYPDFDPDDEHLPALEKEIQNCHQALRDLQELKSHYDRLPPQSKMSWERMGMGTAGLTEIRARISTSSRALTMLTTDMIASSQVNVERLLRRFLHEWEHGYKETSVVSEISCGSLDPTGKEAWKQIRKELQGVGVSPKAFDKNRDFILKTLQETVLEVEDSEGADFGFDFGFQNEASKGNAVQPEAALTDTTTAQKLQKKDRGKDCSSTAPKRSSRLSRLLYRLSSGERDLIDAVEAGNAASVKRILKRGASVDSLWDGETAFLTACKAGHVEIAKLLLAYGADIKLHRQGFLALRESAGRGYKELVQVLLNENIHPNSDEPEWQPLHAAAKKGRSQVLEILLAHGADVKLLDRDGESALMVAATNGHAQSVSILLQYAPSIESEDEKRRTALSKAAEKHHDTVVSVLLDNGAEVQTTDADSRTPLHWAMMTSTPDQEGRARQISTVQILLRDEGRAVVDSVDNFQRTPLVYAAGHGIPAVIEILLEHGVDVNRQIKPGEIPLLIAASSNSTKVVGLLVKAGANVNARDASGEAALCKAVRLGNCLMADLLLANGAETDVKSHDRYTPLQKAVRKGDEAMVRLLLDNRADPNLPNRTGDSVLWTAIRKDNASILELLLQHGADVNSPSKSEEISLLSAIRNKQVAMVEILLKYGASINQQSKNDVTPLWLAVHENNPIMVNLLLEKGADPNLRNHNEMESPLSSSERLCGTPLLLALHNHHPEMITQLLEKGANPNIREPDGASPLSEALKNNDTTLIRLLLDHKADPNSTNDGEPVILQVMRTASSNSTVSRLALFLEYGANPNATSENGDTLLTMAIQHGYFDIAVFSLENGLVPKINDANGQPILSSLPENQNHGEWEDLLEEYRTK